MFFKTLQSRLVTIYLLIVIAIVMVVGVFLFYSIESVFYGYFYNTVVNNFETKGILFSKEIANEDALKSEFFISDLSHVMGIYGYYRELFIFDKNLAVVYPEGKFDSKKPFYPFSTNLIKAIKDGTGKDRNPFYENYFDFAQKINIQNGESYYIYVRFNKTEWQGAMDTVKITLTFSALLAVIVCSFIGYTLSKTIAVPISSLTSKAKRIAQGDFESLVQPKSKDEIGQLTESFNYMAGELRKTLNEISSEKNKIETVLQFMTDGIIAFNLSGQVIHINPAAARMLQVSDSDSKFNDFFRKLNVNIRMEEILYQENTAVIERSTEIKDTFLQLLFAPFTDEANKIEGIIAVVHDITEQQKLDNMRKEFVANVSHELKTPLTSIRSYTETLLEGGIDEKELSERFLAVIHSESIRMQRLVGDLLQLSRLDYKDTQWNMQKIHLESLVKEAVGKIQIEAELKRQKLEYYIIGDIPVIMADKDRIEQVIMNIISNAIKYTQEEGKISVYTGVMHNSVYVKVVDNGIGIPEEDISRIFERFYRVDKARSRELGGTGLGLSIAKEIVDAHDGEILVSSKVGEGTEVVVKFPSGKICNEIVSGL